MYIQCYDKCIEAKFMTSISFSANQLSPDVLKSIFDAAFINCGIDDGCEFYTDDQVRIYLEPRDGPACIQYYTVMQIINKPDIDAMSTLASVITDDIISIKVRVNDSDSLVISYDHLFIDGITAKEIVCIHREFTNLVRASMNHPQVASLREKYASN